MCCDHDRGTGSELVPLSCSICSRPLVEDTLELVQDGVVEGRLCLRCANNLRSILPEINKTFVIIEAPAFNAHEKPADGVETITKALRAAYKEGLFQGGMSDRVFISVDVSTDELMLKLFDGWYKWSRLRETLYKCES